MVFIRLLGLLPLRRDGRLQSPSLTLRRPGVLRDCCFVVLQSLIFSCGSPTMTEWLYNALPAFFLRAYGLSVYHSVWVT